MSFFGIGNDILLSPEQKRKREEAYYNKVYPFGKAQQDYEDEIIGHYFSDDKKMIPTIKYMCLIRREMYADKQETNADYNKTLKRIKLTDKQKQFVEVFSKLVSEAKNYDELPTIETLDKEL